MRHYPAITGLTRTVYSLRGMPALTVFRPVEMLDHFPILLSWRPFRIGASDYDGPTDECYCPCGATVRAGDGGIDLVLGDLVDAADDHIAERHPGVRQ